jgi:hypothetical protein
MVDVMPFKFEHFQALDIGRPHQAFFYDFPEYDKLLRAAENQTSWSGFHEGRVIACGGIVKLWRGVGEGWLFTSPEIIRHKISLTKIVKRLLFKAEQETGLHRIQALVLETFTQGRAWIQLLGFKSEGVLSCYGPNRENFIMYGRTR